MSVVEGYEAVGEAGGMGWGGVLVCVVVEVWVVGVVVVGVVVVVVLLEGILFFVVVVFAVRVAGGVGGGEAEVRWEGGKGGEDWPARRRV